MNNEEIKELKEKIVRLQNFHKIKDKKIKLMEDRIERQNKLIAKQKERTNRAIKYIKEYIKQLPSNEYIGYWKTDILEDIDKIKENSNE